MGPNGDIDPPGPVRRKFFTSYTPLEDEYDKILPMKLQTLNVESVSGSDFIVANTSFVNLYDEATYNWYQYYSTVNRRIVSIDINGLYFMNKLV